MQRSKCLLFAFTEWRVSVLFYPREFKCRLYGQCFTFLTTIDLKRKSGKCYQESMSHCHSTNRSIRKTGQCLSTKKLTIKFAKYLQSDGIWRSFAVPSTDMICTHFGYAFLFDIFSIMASISWFHSINSNIKMSGGIFCPNKTNKQIFKNKHNQYFLWTHFKP